MRRSRAALVMSLLAIVACAGGAARHDARNAVVICIDTVRSDTFELVDAAAGDARSPLWRRAVRFDRAQAASPWTLPSVASVFTGFYPNVHGAGAFTGAVAHLGAQWPTPLSEDAVTLPERLRRRGFATAAFVAHPWFDDLYGLSQGFDTALVEPAPGAHLVERAEAWLDGLPPEEGAGDRPQFFLYLHFMEAHATNAAAAPPGHAMELSEDLRSRALAEAPAAACGDEDSATCQDYLFYVANVRTVHRSTDRLLRVLDERGLMDDTAVLLFSDHGSEFLEHVDAQRRYGLDPRDRYGRYHGHALYQELLGVPFLLWHPALRGQRSDAPVSLVDVTPTLLDALGLETPPRPPGRSLMAALGADGIAPDRPLFSSGIAYGPERAAVVRGTQKRISAAGDAPARLFDLSSDPDEREPRMRPSPELDRLLGAYRRKREAPGAPVTLSEDRLSELQALGYLTEVAPE